MSNDKMIQSVIDMLVHVETAAGEIKKVDETTDVHLTLSCATDEPGVVKPIEMTLTQFNAIYAGFVKLWPVIKPLKDEVAVTQRMEVKAKADVDRQATKDAKLAEHKATVAANAAARKAQIDANRVAKQAEKDKAMAEREAKLAHDRAAKLKADKEQAQKAANALAVNKVGERPRLVKPAAPVRPAQVAKPVVKK